jgi:peptidyl-dipeptidase A
MQWRSGLGSGLLALSAAAAAVMGAAEPAKPTAQEAAAFLEKAEARLLDLQVKNDRASWVQQTYITDDTEQLAAEAQKVLTATNMDLAGQATRFDGLSLPEDVARRLKLLKTAITLPVPRDDAEQTELTQISASLESLYGKGSYTPPGKEPMGITELGRTMATSRDPRELLDVWRGWQAVGAPMRGKYERFVQLTNKGARQLGFADTGALWRSGYDMPPEEFSAELDRLWAQVKPLYDALHAHVRATLAAKYGKDLVPEQGPIPAHLLGNMWAQDWINIYPFVAPPGTASTFDVTEMLKAKRVEPLGMVHYGEGFFTSLGFEALPKTFWERSLFLKPKDRDVVCHASAWDIDQEDDLRIKMCIEQTGEDFVTIHHELGHNFYQRAYKHQPFLFRNSANDGFHEAIGDTIALSVTPQYLKRLGLMAKDQPEGSALGLLMHRALEKVAFLPFGLLIDQWRWKVFSGEITPAQYNKAWWDLRLKYQGVAPPMARSEADFDPGAKYHVAANVPYTRYFLATILQFQFHRGLCREAGFSGPLHECSIYGNAAAGARLKKVLEMGQSRPWPEALQALTGETRMDATAMLDYFAPLKKWLDEQNKNRKVGF